jgi:hypothetical protein
VQDVVYSRLYRISLRRGQNQIFLDDLSKSHSAVRRYSEGGQLAGLKIIPGEDNAAISG